MKTFVIYSLSKFKTYFKNVLFSKTGLFKKMLPYQVFVDFFQEAVSELVKVAFSIKYYASSILWSNTLSEKGLKNKASPLVHLSVQKKFLRTWQIILT